MPNFPDFSRLSHLTSFGYAVGSAAYVYRPTQAEQIATLFHHAAQNGYSIALRGSGRSYGDAALNGGQVVLDLRRMNRIREWNPVTGVIRVEPGVTIQQIIYYVLEDGWWPPVVPGTMLPTLGGCLGMNIHGKNNFVAGPIGEHVLAFTALLPNGKEITCSREENSALFHALIGGLGVLGVFTSITLQLKHIYSGDLAVEAWATPTLAASLSDVGAHAPHNDYTVGWIDTTAGWGALGRGQLHTARYLAPGADPAPARTLHLDHQTLPDTIMGLIPKSILWRFMRPFAPRFAWSQVNTGKYLWSRLHSHHARFRQSLIAFNFLLDYVPNWEKAYGSRGLIQFQCFVPQATALQAFDQVLRHSQRRGMPAYLGVVKRHRPDAFLLSHAVDGYSLALDYPVPGRPERLQRLADELTEFVLAAGGRFYFAKDSTLRPAAAAQFLGAETVARFRAFKAECDPESVLQTELYRRLFTATATSAE